jgi:tRNA threonylcarbamoyladenosine biosynthesis protein TsaE
MAESIREVEVPDERAMLALGAKLAAALDASQASIVVFLTGELGTGKTTLVRGMLRALGIEGAIRSPTFTLLEIYPVGARWIAHLDLYRLENPGRDELEALGLRDVLSTGHALFIEWPQRAAGVLPQPDFSVQIEFAGTQRRVAISVRSPRGSAMVQKWLS